MLKIIDLYKKYKIKNGPTVNALNGINYEFNNNGLYFILGKSGCGKSTFLNLISGLDNVSSGEILYNDFNISNANENDLDDFRNKNIGYLFQEFNLLPNLNVKDNVAISMKLLGKNSTEEEIINALENVGIADLINRRINELSGGQKQRVALARALIKKPKIILADEPTGALDSSSSKDIFNLLKEISKNHLVIVVTHDEEYANFFGDIILKFDDGHLVNIEEKNNISVDNNILKNDENIHYGLSIMSSIKFGFSNLKIKYFRLIITIILCACSFSCLGAFLCIANYSLDDYIVRILEDRGNTDFITAYVSYLDESSLNDINSKLNSSFIGFNDVYDVPAKSYIEGTNINLWSHSITGCVIGDENVLDKLDMNVVGTYPGINEVAITDWQIDSYKQQNFEFSDGSMINENMPYDEIIGKYIDIEYKGQIYSCKITGIIITGFYDLPYFNIILNQENYSDAKVLEANRMLGYYSGASNTSTALKSYHRSLSFYTAIYSSGFDFTDNMNFYTDIMEYIPNNKSEIVNTLDYFENNSISVYFSLDNQVYQIDGTLEFYKKLTFYLSIGFMIFAMLLLFSFINFSINNKTKEMGILKALGAKKRDIFIIYSIEGFILAIINYLLSIVGTILLLIYI